MWLDGSLLSRESALHLRTQNRGSLQKKQKEKEGEEKNEDP